MKRAAPKDEPEDEEDAPKAKRAKVPEKKPIGMSPSLSMCSSLTGSFNSQSHGQSPAKSVSNSEEGKDPRST